MLAGQTPEVRQAGQGGPGGAAAQGATRVGKWHGAVPPGWESGTVQCCHTGLSAVGPPAEPGRCLVVHRGGWAAPETPPKPSLAAGWGGDD